MRAAAWPEILELADPNELLERLCGGLGFGEPATAGPDTRSALGVPEDLTSIRLAAGPGTTRLMLVIGRDEVPGREQVARLAAGLSRKAPHLMWLVALVLPRKPELVLGTWNAGSIPTRVAALVVDRQRVMPSDAETLVSLGASLEGSDLEIHAHWTEILGREAISRRFFLALQGILAQLADHAAGRSSAGARREIALLYVSRLLFLAFLESRGWLDSDQRFLVRSFDDCMASGGRFQRRVLEPLFFGTLNTPASKRAALARSLGRIPFLNGGLFSRSHSERLQRDLVMRDEDFGDAFDRLLVRYRFSPREETSTWHESAIDPEILGRAFESLMHLPERRATGAFYTPVSLVARVTDSALETMLERRGVAEGTLERVASGERLPAPDASVLRAALGGLRVLDPACGSGAFLVHLVDRLTHLRLAAGDSRSPSAIRREVVAQQVFGVDVNPTAVWLCELRLWLSLVIDHPAADPSAVPPLPNLDHNIRCGDTLAGGDFSAGGCASRNNALAVGLRARYARSTGPRKRTLSRALERLERANLVAWLDARLEHVSAQRRSLVGAARGRDLFGGRRGVLSHEREEALLLRANARELRSRRRAVAGGGALPFVFAAHFPDAARAGGFDIVVGNPPWIRVHHIPATKRETLRREFRVYREAAWQSGARAARAGSGFGSQVDAASLFLERSHQLLREDGVLALLVPSKLWRSLAGGGVRRLIAERSTLAVLEDWSEAPAMFDAATYPSLVVASKTPPTAPAESIRLAVHRGRVQVAWAAARVALPLDDTAGAPWLMLPPEARSAFDRLTRHGTPLSESGLGVATLGVKCGCNEAFLVRAARHLGGVEVTDGTRTELVDRQFVRPLLRGDAVRAWRADRCDECIVFPYTGDGRILDRLTPSLRTWLLPWRSRLEARADARGNRAWWSLFRLEGSRSDWPRVVWADLGKSLQAMVLDAGDRTVPLNTCYVLPTRDPVDAFALSALLNSPLADAWIGAIAEPARGGYRRHFAWTMARLPVPDDWARARDVLSPLGERGLRGEAPGEAELMHGALEAFRIRPRSLMPLIEWMNG